MYRQRACYVSIMENPGRYLRAMAGQALPRQATLAEEIIANTTAAIEGSPHRRIRQADLSYLSYNVALLGPLQRVSDAEHLNPSRFGLYVKSDRGRSALLLPHRAGVETANDQIATVFREAGIDTRREDATMYRFEVTYFDA
jgi:AMMECR1 domain-containing protein